jgi:hypothetical protein
MMAPIFRASLLRSEPSSRVGFPHANRPTPNTERHISRLFQGQVATALVQLAVIGIEKAAPPIKQWWRDQAAPAVRSTSGKVASKLSLNPPIGFLGWMIPELGRRP